MDSLKASRVNYRPIHTHRNDTIQGDLDRPQVPNHFPNPCKYNLWPSAILKNLKEGKLLRRRINNVATRFTSYLSANQRFFRPVSRGSSQRSKWRVGRHFECRADPGDEVASSPTRVIDGITRCDAFFFVLFHNKQ